MFDTTPPNLPVEPVMPPKTMPPADASIKAGTGPMPVPLSSKGKKEPEDIFAGIDVAEEQKAANAGDLMAEAAPRRSPMFIVGVVIAGLLVVGIAGYVIWAFVLQPQPASAPTGTESPPTSQAPVPAPVIERPPASALQTEPAADVVEESASPITLPPPGTNIPLPGGTAPAESPFPPQAIVPIEGVDSDSDALTDIEEALYRTDAASVDTDGDGYSDGSEVVDIFNPAGKGESLTKNPGIAPLQWNGWSVLLPVSWIASADPQDPSIGVITTGSLTRLTMQSRANASRQSLADWVGPGAVGMTSFTTKNGLRALRSSDGLTTYLAADDTILIVGYELNGDTSYEYRTTYHMMVNSLRSPAP